MSSFLFVSFWALVVLSVLALVSVLVLLFKDEWRKFFRWLKGFRKIYYRQHHPCYGLQVYSCPNRLRAIDWSCVDGSVIEINRGPFRRRSAIYGPAADFWRIAGSWHRERTGDWVRLEQVLQGLKVEVALQFINTYPSLQAMLDRIDELGRERLDDKAKIQELSAAICALYKQIISDRQRYRGAVALELRHDLETIINEANVSASSKWTFFETWEKRFEQNRDLRKKVSRGQD